MISIKLTLLFAGLFFLTALVTGVWKFYHMHHSESAEAPTYVNIAHRASLMYSFAALLVAQFLEYSPWSPGVNIFASMTLMLFFGGTILRYIQLGLTGETDNQFKDRNFFTVQLMFALIVAEIGGFLILYVGYVKSWLF